MSGLIIDLFAGGGGASEGIRMALGRDPDVAVNHDPLAVAMHKANHPGTMHVCQDIWSCPPNWATRGKPVALLWGSPDCTHHSKAKGGPPNRDEKRRDLAWVIVKWAREVRPTVIIMENVEEFTSWGPCDKDGIPIKSQAGASFRSFKATLRRLGYAVQHRELRACDYGAPTIRKRLFLIARRDGRPIVWPEATHGPGKPLPYRTAAQCIDWTLECPSIFERKKPLAENTLKRIATGIKRYVLDAAQPFIVNLTHGVRLEPLNEPMRTITCAHRGEKALVLPASIGIDQQGARSAVWNPDAPLSTIVTKGKHALVAPVLVTNTTGHAASPVDGQVPTLTTGQQQMLVAPTMIQTGYGEREGQAPRALDLGAPLGTVVAGGQKHALVSAFMAKHFTGVVGSDLAEPLATVTTIDHHSLVTATLEEAHDGRDGDGEAAAGGRGDRGQAGRVNLEAPQPERDAPEGAQALGDNHQARISGDQGQPQQAGPHAGSSQGRVDRLAGVHPGGHGHQPHRRVQDEQCAEESGTGHALGEPSARLQDRSARAVGEHPTENPGECRTAREGTAGPGLEFQRDSEGARDFADHRVQGHAHEVAAFLLKFYSQGGQWQSPSESMHTIPTKDRMGLVTVTIEGQPYVIADIGMRMLQPRELYRAQGFPDSYIIGDDPAQGLALTKKDMVRMCGNSVCPPIAAAMIRANYSGALREERELPLLEATHG